MRVSLNIFTSTHVLHVLSTIVGANLCSLLESCTSTSVVGCLPFTLTIFKYTISVLDCLTQHPSSYPRPVPMSTMHRAQWIWLTLAISIFPSLSTTSPLTYYIADSCNAYPIIPKIMTDATSTIYNTWRRNKFKTLDPNFQTAFKTVLKTEQSSPQLFDIWGYFGKTAFSIVDSTTSLLGTLQRTYDLDTSDIRIVCDGDTYGGPNDRWQPVPDYKLPTNIQSGTAPKPNSKRTPGVDQEFFDQVNFMRRSTTSLGCQGPGGVRASTDIYSMAPFDFNGRAAPEGLPARRTVISVCDASVSKFQADRLY